jgi:hypothetical protein
VNLATERLRPPYSVSVLPSALTRPLAWSVYMFSAKAGSSLRKNANDAMRKLVAKTKL